MKTHFNVYKKDNWNQMNILVHGKRIVVSELSSVYGETTFEFMSKNEMVHWAREYFKDESEEELARIIGVFASV